MQTFRTIAIVAFVSVFIGVGISLTFFGHAAADFNGDGTFNIADLSILLSNWGT